MQVADLIAALRKLAPESLAESWDKVGLHVGDPQQPLSRVLLCIDLTPPVVEEAIRDGAQLIIAYHPPIFQPLARLTPDTWKQRMLLDLIRHGIAVYSPHTALDAACDGVNDWLAKGVGEGDTQPIRRADDSPRFVKVVTFVPPESLEAVRTAMSDAGAGVIGDYTQCAFSQPGEGTFHGSESTNPAVGQAGRLERVEERRMEMRCEATRLADVLAAHRKAHPYEEPAVDVYPLAAQPDAVPQTGQGRIVRLRKPVRLKGLIERLRTHLGVRHLHVAAGDGRMIRTVGLCAGAGGSLLDEAGDIDAFFTGEMRHHDILDAQQRGIAVILAGHTETERPYLKVLRDRLAATAGDLTITVSRSDLSPLRVL